MRRQASAKLTIRIPKKRRGRAHSRSMGVALGIVALAFAGTYFSREDALEQPKTKAVVASGANQAKREQSPATPSETQAVVSSRKNQELTAQLHAIPSTTPIAIATSTFNKAQHGQSTSEIEIKRIVLGPTSKSTVLRCKAETDWTGAAADLEINLNKNTNQLVAVHNIGNQPLSLGTDKSDVVFRSQCTQQLVPNTTCFISAFQAQFSNNQEYNVLMHGGNSTISVTCEQKITMP